MDELLWVDAEGTAWTFTQEGTPGHDAEFPLKGRLGAKWDFIEQAFGQGDGASVEDVSAPLREQSFPFSMYGGASEPALKVMLDQWLWRLDPSRGAGALRSIRADGSTIRDFPSRYKSGFDDAIEGEASGLLANAQLKTLLTFRGGPFWQDYADQEVTFTAGNSNRLWFPMSFPWYLDSSTIFDSKVVTNDGHRPAWPVWSIRGPGSNIVLRDRTTGQWLAVDINLPLGEILTIDTRVPGRKTVRTSSGSFMSATRGSMFPLGTGEHDIAIEMGNVDASSYVVLQYKRLWNNP